jgi:hypothetical protein
MEDIAPVHLFLMSNCAQSGKDIMNVFDLKGSLINREEKNPDAGTLKDVNLLKICNKTKLLKFRQKDMRDLNSQIKSDITFLGSHHIMDYSLLLVVEINPDWQAAKDARAFKRKS